MTDNNTFFVTGGGTGGHIYPALAVADLLSDENAKVCYVGNRHNMEFNLALKKGYKFLHVGVSGMPRKLSPKLIYWGIRLIRAILFSVRYIKKYKPHAVFATGGYVSAPLIFACIITKTPYMMHDCDAMPGLVSRKLSKHAKCVSLAFEKAKKYIPNKKIVVTGNPIREEFKLITKTMARKNLNLAEKITLIVMGGSQGAKSINNATVELLKEISLDFDLQVIFQTGRKNYDEVINRLEQFYPNYAEDKNLIIRPYFDNMISVLKAGDIVLSRAGSLSLSEICASNLVPILVPYPYAAANHQRINAKCLFDEGACVYIEDKDLDPNKLKDTILELLNNPIKMNYLKQNTARLAKFDATERIVTLLKTIKK